MMPEATTDSAVPMSNGIVMLLRANLRTNVFGPCVLSPYEMKYLRSSISLTLLISAFLGSGSKRCCGVTWVEKPDSGNPRDRFWRKQP